MRRVFHWAAPAIAILALAGGVAPDSQTHLGRTGTIHGKAFDRIVFIWLENTDYDMAIGDPNLAYLAKQGILLDNMFAVTHPSQPNYVASIGGDTFGMDNDAYHDVPHNISSVIDLLEDKDISWGEYMEGMPYTGFTGSYPNPANGRNNYVRKHNPAISYKSVTNVPDRLSQIKNFTLFYEDLEANALPQWITLTPNMTNDGHDTSVTVAGAWARSFLEPLLNDTRFMQNTAVLLTFDENETYGIQNKVVGILLGDAVPLDLVGTIDSTFYDHYSQISTVEANWNLHTLGRFDVGANVYSFVSKKTGDIVRSWLSPPLNSVQLASSYPGMFNGWNHAVPIPAPNVTALYAGRSVLPAIQKFWNADQASSYYSTCLEIPDGDRPPVYHGQMLESPMHSKSETPSPASVLRDLGYYPLILFVLVGMTLMV